MANDIIKGFTQAGITTPSIQEVIERHKGQALKDRLKDLEDDNPNALAKIKQEARGRNCITSKYL